MNIEKISVNLKRIHFVRFLLVVLGVNLGIWGFLVLPKQDRIAALQKNYADLRNQGAADQKEIKQLQARLKHLQQAQEDLKTIYNKLLIRRTEGMSIRMELEGLANNLQVKRSDFSYDYKQLEDFGLQHFMLSVPVEGNYRNIRRFINSIERSEHFLILDRVDLSSERKEDILNLDFTLSTYLVEDEK
ncbi:type 4a pilus biogenesis protein PilO [bacterium]|nr:type 4a pilus biogenesis protein PilO [bacterium]